MALISEMVNFGYLIDTEVEPAGLMPVSKSLAEKYAKVADDDDVLNLLIASSLDAFENYTQSLLFIREVKATFKGIGNSVFKLPFAPIIEIDSVKVDGEDVSYELKGDRIELEMDGDLLEVVYQAGITSEDVPNDIQEGCLKYIASNYADREDYAVDSVNEMPNGSRQKWARYRNVRI